MQNPFSLFRQQGRLGLVMVVLGVLATARFCFAQGTGQVEIDVVDDDTDEALVFRAHVQDATGRTLRLRRSLHSGQWNLVESPLRYRGKPGDYLYRISHGPEFPSGSGGFTLDRKSEGYDIVRLPRKADMKSEGWFAGDLMSQTPAEQNIRWQPAECLDMSVAVSNTAIRDESGLVETIRSEDHAGNWAEKETYHDTRAGSGLLLHHWLPPAKVPREVPSSRLLVMAKRESSEGESATVPVHAEIQRLWARDVPIWLASQRIDSIQLMSDHLSYDGEQEAPVKLLVDPAPGRYRGKTAIGRTVELIYWNVLEAGLKIPPTAGSGFGKGTSPLGYNRVYAHVPLTSASASTTPESWWKAVREGQSFVTNGPLLRTTVNGHVPGTTFFGRSDLGVELEVALKLTVADPVEYLDVIFNGQKLYQARLDEYAKEGGKIPLLNVKESGWLVVRVVTERDFSYRFATTAPYYVTIDEQPRISKKAVEFFQTWLKMAATDIEQSSSSEAAAPFVKSAYDYWGKRLEQANVP